MYLNIAFEKAKCFICKVTLSLCLPHLSSTEIVTPRYKAAGTLSSSVLRKKFSEGMGFLSQVTCKNGHFELLKLMSQTSSHCPSLRRSSCRIFTSDREIIHRYKAVPSNNRTLYLTCSGSSFIYAKKRIGPRSEPCGTTEETRKELELIPLVTTDCFLLSKNPL